MNKKRGFSNSEKALAAAQTALVEDITNKFKGGKEHSIELLPKSILPSRTIFVERVGDDLMVRDDGKSIRHQLRELSIDLLIDIRDSIIAGMVDVDKP